MHFCIGFVGGEEGFAERNVEIDARGERGGSIAKLGCASFVYAVREQDGFDLCFTHEMSLSGFGSSVCIEHAFAIFDSEGDFVDVFVVCMDVVDVGDGENLE